VRNSCVILSLTCALLLSGCSVAPLATSASNPPSTSTGAVPGAAFKGRVHGGQNPIQNAHVYLYAINNTGYGGESDSVLTSAGNTTKDGSGNYYVTTDSSGNFSVTGDYTCTEGISHLYVYAIGGNPGAGTNLAAGLMASLQSCTLPNFSSTFVDVNEVSTVATAYAFAGFAADATHFSIPNDSLAAAGMNNASKTVANLETLSTGVALATTPAGNGTVPQNEINTLANILASCINSDGTVTGPTNPTACYTLFTSALSGGSTGAQPTDTATAAINIAHNPGANIGPLYGLSVGTPPFEPALTAQPKDFTIGLIYTGTSLNEITAFDFDGSGNLWVENELNPTSNISEFSPIGTELSPSGGFTGGGLNTPNGLAIDNSGNVWASSFPNNSVNEFSSSGVAISPSTGYTGGGLNNARAIAIDTSGNAWLANIGANSISEFSSGGTAITSTSGYTGGGLDNPRQITFDGAGDSWLPNENNNSLSKFNSAGTAISTSSGYTGGGLNAPKSVALDSSGNVWVANSGNSTISKFNTSGTAISGSSGYSGGGLDGIIVVAIDGAGNVWAANSGNNSVSEFNSTGIAITGSNGYTCGGCMTSPVGPAIDGSGNVWVANNNSTISELIGAATPVITPLVAGLPLTPTGNGSSNLGTRP
jgi:sugar lactone lactonase YvrE